MDHGLPSSLSRTATSPAVAAAAVAAALVRRNTSTPDGTDHHLLHLPNILRLNNHHHHHSNDNNNHQNQEHHQEQHGRQNPSTTTTTTTTTTSSQEKDTQHNHPYSTPDAARSRLSLTRIWSPDNYGMDAVTRATSGSRSSGAGSNASSSAARDRDDALSFLENPYELRHGRRYIRDVPYPLPCDLAETQRQSMRTMLGMAVFGKASCSPAVAKKAPKKVLELGCGGAYWTAICHDWFETQGYKNVSFTGIDIAPIAPDLSKQGIDWRFIQHDLRRLPWPFADGEFDFIMVKDMCLAVDIGIPSQNWMDEMIRILAEGGSLECWESDHVLRCLRPHPPSPPGMLKPEEERAIATKTYLISPGTPFAPAQNRYVVDSNAWVSSALDALKLPPTPCSRLLHSLYQEADTLTDIGFRRVAVPLGELRWEKDKADDGSSPASGASSAQKGKGRAATAASGAVKVVGDDVPVSNILTPDQAALRYTALLTVIGKIESLEPILKEASGKNSEEWSRWWENMMNSLLDQENNSCGEVLEVGTWWATKRTMNGV